MSEEDTPSPPPRRRRRPGTALPTATAQLDALRVLHGVPLVTRKPTLKGIPAATSSVKSSHPRTSSAAMRASFGGDTFASSAASHPVASDITPKPPHSGPQAIASSSAACNPSNAESQDARPERELCIASENSTHQARDVAREKVTLANSHVTTTEQSTTSTSCGKNNVEKNRKLASTGTPGWAAAVLTSMARGATTMLATTPSGKRTREEEAFDSDDSTELPVSVDDFLTALPRTLHAAKKTYASQNRHKKHKRNHSTTRSARSRTAHSKRGRKLPIIADSSSEGDFEDGTTDSDREGDFFQAPAKSSAASRRALQHLPPFSGASQVDPVRDLRPPYPCKNRPPPLSFVTTAELTDSDDEAAAEHSTGEGAESRAGRRKTKNRRPSFTQRSFISSIADTAFVTSDRRATRPLAQACTIEGKATRRITSRIPAEEAFVELAQPVGRSKTGIVGRKCKFPPLELSKASDQDDEMAVESGANGPSPDLYFADQHVPAGSPRYQPATPARNFGTNITMNAPQQAATTLQTDCPSSFDHKSHCKSRGAPWSPGRIEKMEQDFDLRLKKKQRPVTSVVPRRDSCVPAASAHAEPQLHEHTAADENDTIDPIALLPTPVPPRFRFTNGSSVRSRKAPPKLHLAPTAPDDDDDGCWPSPSYARIVEHESPLVGQLDLVPAAEFEANLQLEEAEADEWDMDGEALKQLDNTGGGQTRSTCPPSTPGAQQATRALERRVTFSSPVAPLASSFAWPSQRPRHLPAHRSPAAVRAAVSSGLKPIIRSATTPCRLKKRAVSTALTPKKRVAITPRQRSKTTPRSRSTSKPLRRVSLIPNFTIPLPGEAEDEKENVDAQVVAGNVNEDQALDVHPSSHEATPSPVPPPRHTSYLSPLPAAQPLVRIPTRTDSSSSATSGSDADERTWRPGGGWPTVVVDYIPVIADESEPSLSLLLEEAEDQIGHDSVPSDLELGDHTASLDMPTSLLLDETVKASDSSYVLDAKRAILPSRLQVAALPKTIGTTTTVPFDPNAIMSLPSTFTNLGGSAVTTTTTFKTRAPCRSTTVWGGQRLSQLGKVSLQDLVALKVG